MTLDVGIETLIIASFFISTHPNDEKSSHFYANDGEILKDVTFDRFLAVAVTLP